MSSLPNIKSAFIKRFNTTAGIIVTISILVGTGISIGKFYGEVIAKGEIMELKVKQAKELMDIREKHTFEVLELKQRINLLEIDNEKRKKGIQ